MNKIEQIKAEIDKLYGKYKDKFLQCGDQYHLGLFDGLDMAKRVLDTLESEKPMNLDFEQELYNRFGMVKDFTLGMRIAEYFYNLGCRRTAEKYDEIEYNRQRTEQRWLEDRDGCFWDGVNEGKKAMEEQMMKDGNVILAEEDFEAEKEKSMKWGYNLCKEQMMKEAVEGMVTTNLANRPVIYLDQLKGFEYGDKVKIIIVKEEEK